MAALDQNGHLLDAMGALLDEACGAYVDRSLQQADDFAQQAAEYAQQARELAQQATNIRDTLVAQQGDHWSMHTSSFLANSNLSRAIVSLLVFLASYVRPASMLMDAKVVDAFVRELYSTKDLPLGGRNTGRGNHIKRHSRVL